MISKLSGTIKWMKHFTKGANTMKSENALPTMKDVAREAGVALGTVSKVMNGIPVGESYRRKVEEAAQKLGYQVNNYARGLKTNKTYCMAFIIPSVTHPFFAHLVQEVGKALSQRGYRMLLMITDFDQEAEQTCINMIRMNKVDGAIGLTYNPNLEVDEALPFVTIDRYFSSTIPCVSSDNFGGGRLAAQKLWELGCRHPAFFRIGSRVPGEADKRGDGFESFYRLKNMDYEVLRLYDGEEMAQFSQLLQKNLEAGTPIDGIFCGTDQLAWRVEKMVKALGQRVPEDVQIIGFDGIRRFGDQDLYCSTIVQPVAKIAQTCVDILLNSNRADLPATVCLPVSFAPGGTTKE